MVATEWIFWLSVGLVGYAYILYPAILWVVCRTARSTGGKRTPGVHSGSPALPFDCPTVSLVVPAYNEEKHLAAKLANLDEVDYRKDRMETIFVSDGSTDGTDALLAAVCRPRFRVFRLPSRRGKPGALNRAAAAARGDILVFSDASTLFAADAVRKLARHFVDPTVGVVCGALGFTRTEESAGTEGVYWTYETALRRMEAGIGATLTASGAIYAVRRCCFRPIAPDTILEDFLVPMTARRLGYRVLYDPEARACDTAAPTVGGEFTRRARIAAGSFRALAPLARAALTSPAVLWAFLSHKLLRWLAPVFLLALGAASLVLRTRPVYGFALALQAAFYLWALAGLVFRDRLREVRFALVGYFLVAMNLAFLVGLARSVSGRQPVTWTRVNG
ncbi:MAG: glycosyltransferase family 2 protein [Acidobacteriota bacterium]|nr:glycosyltransferase family 2 protein [Acidobacteriota bacterium]